MSELPVVIVGAGVSGLTTALELTRAGQKTLLFEANHRLGGTIVTEQHDGFLYDVGADSFLKTKPEGLELCRELELESELITPLPATHSVFVARDGALFPMPAGLSLGVPTSVTALLDTPLLSDLGKARALLEPFVPRRNHAGEESILGFLRRRLGSEMAESLAGPLLAGVSAGDGDRLSIDAAFPQLVALEQSHGSLFLGLSGQRSLLSALLRKPPARGSPFVSLRRGLGQMIRRLSERLPEGIVHLGARVERLEARAGGVAVHVGGEVIDASHVVVTGPPWSGADLLSTSASKLASLLSEVRGAPTATVFFGMRESGLERELSGSGFIVPPGEGQILAATYVSSKWRERAPVGRALVRAFVGGSRDTSIDVQASSDDELLRLAHRELTRLMGGLGQVEFGRVYRYARGNPQLELGHGARLSAVARELGELPWLSLTGPGYDGVGIPDCVRGARATAQRILAAFSH